MSVAVAKIGTVVINVSDVEVEKAFWSALLGTGIRNEFPGFCWFEPQHPGGVMLALQASPEPGGLSGRVHLDTQVDDVAEARTAVEALGGTFVEEHEAAGFRWAIMADPEGNRFCIASGH